MRRTALIITMAMALGNIGQAARADLPGRLQVHEVPVALPEVAFQDRSGDPVKLADFRGKTVLLNIWATWCIPCREEMPSLDRLQAQLGGKNFQVVALSIDHGGLKVVRQFYAEIGISHLEIFMDPTAKVAGDLAIVGLPVTLLVSAEGRETARAIGPVPWDDPAIIAFIRKQIGQQTFGPPSPELKFAGLPDGVHLATSTQLKD